MRLVQFKNYKHPLPYKEFSVTWAVYLAVCSTINRHGLTSVSEVAKQVDETDEYTERILRLIEQDGHVELI